jgi:hypothetical protein
MAKKTKIIDTKNVSKKVMPAIVDAAVSTTGYLGTKILSSKLEAKQPKLTKAKGPAAFLLGSVIAAMANTKDKNGNLLKQFGVGMATYGGSEMADAFIPEDTKAKIGLSGTDNNQIDAEEIAKQVAQEVEQEFQGIYDDNEYLPVTDDKLVDEPGIDSGTVKIDPLPGPLPVHNSVVSVSTSKNAPSRPPINIPAIIKTKISGFSGIDAQDEDDDETVLENLI